nr:acyl-CoA dehydrogenase family protein [Actinoalloteichus spitiensis]
MVAVTSRIAEGCLSSALVYAMHCQQVDAIVRHAGRELRAHLLPRVASGGTYLASITTELGSSGLLTCDQELVPDGEHHVVRREAPVVTGGRHADGFLVTMRAAPDATPRQVSLVYADRDQVEVTAGPPWASLGMRGVENVGLTVSGRVPDGQVLGVPGGFADIAVESFAPVAHLGWSAAWLGAARGAFGELVRRIRRTDGVRADPRSELVRHRVARVRVRLEAVGGYLSGVLDEVLGAHERGSSLAGASCQIHLNTLKVLAAEETYAAANEMVELAGLRAGYLRGSRPPLERLVRDLRSASLNHDDAALLTSSGALCLLEPTVTTLGPDPRSVCR